MIYLFKKWDKTSNKWDTLFQNQKGMHQKYVFTKGLNSRYQTAPICPCGKSNRDGKFIPFILEGKPNPYFGFCHSCGKTFLPEFPFKSKDISAKKVQFNHDVTNYVRSEEVLQTMSVTNSNPFMGFLEELFPYTYLALKNKYKIGTYKSHGTVFWYRNVDGYFMNGKVVYYSENGLRIKSQPIFNLYPRSKGYETCLFNENFLRSHSKEKPVYLVESEKTAIVCQETFEDTCWLATGGANGLTEEKALVLLGHQIIYVHDCDDAGRKSSEKTLQLLKALKIKAISIDLATNREDGTDILDLLLDP